MTSSSYVARVNQLDANQLDQEIIKIINEQLQSFYGELPPGLLSKFQPEIDLTIKSLIWFYSIAKSKASFGHSILSIRYKNLTKNQKISHYIASVGFRYVKEVSLMRFTNQLQLQKSLAWIECTIRIFSLLNFFRFLTKGNYPNLIDLCLSLNLVSSSTKTRNIGYAYMSRELIWAGFMELLVVTFPLVNYHAVKRNVCNVFKSTKPNDIITNIQFDIHSKCAVCDSRPTLPHQIGCQHLFCYYCLYSNKKADIKFSCPLCDHATSEIHSVIIKV